MPRQNILRPSTALYLALAAAPLAAETYDPKAPIASVTVYRSEAMVLRQGETKVAAGEHSLLVRGLPANFDANTLQVRIAGVAGLQMGGVELRHLPQDELANPEEAALEQRLTAARDELAATQAERESGEAAIRFIQSLIDGKLTRTPDGVAGRLDPDSWRRGWESVGQGMLQQRQKVQAAQARERVTARRIETLERQLDALKSGRRETRTAVIAVRAAQAGNLRFDLSYLMQGASWRPLFEARLDTAGRALALTERAVVTQRTGEDWNGVRLVLSTSAPRSASRAPELDEWRLQFAMPMRLNKAEGKYRAVAPAPAPAVSSFMPSDKLSAAGDDAMPAAEEIAQTGGSAFETEYRIPGHVTVTADASPRKVTLRESALDARLSARIAPAVDTRAFLVGSVRHGGAEPLLAGSWLMFRDGALVGEHRRELVRPGEEIALSFGVDDRIEVKRTTRIDTRGERGLTGQKATLEREWKTSVKNRHATPIAVELHDRFPVAAADDIEVEPLTVEPAASVRDFEGKRGVAVWRFELAADASRELVFGYRVTWPKDRVVTGL